jgi:hypothetical protein
MEDVVKRSIRRLRAKGWSLVDIADRHQISLADVRIVLGMEVERGVLL